MINDYNKLTMRKKLDENKVSSWTSKELLQNGYGAGSSKRNNYFLPIEVVWRTDMDYMLKNAKTPEDMNRIGDKLAEAKDRGYDVDFFDYTLSASRKRKEIYNGLEESVSEGKTQKMTREEVSKIFNK